MAHENESDKANRVERERMEEKVRYKKRKEERERKRERAGNGMIIIK